MSEKEWLIQENGYWVDYHQNKWNCELCTKEEALKCSKTLQNCTGCIDCSFCSNCHSCKDCRLCDYCVDSNSCRNSDSLCDCECCSYCFRCRKCIDCSWSVSLKDCKRCYYCGDCYGCIACFYSNYCDSCTNCEYCFGCRSFSSTPSSYTTHNIGSRISKTRFYSGEISGRITVQVVCGCFKGDLEDFERAVMKTHANNEICRTQYLNEIQKVVILFELAGKKDV